MLGVNEGENVGKGVLVFWGIELLLLVTSGAFLWEEEGALVLLIFEGTLVGSNGWGYAEERLL